MTSRPYVLTEMETYEQVEEGCAQARQATDADADSARA